jgi:putative transferase (TIGR04331 family)
LPNFQQITEEPVFIALTALEEFWDTTGPVVFLGPWCMRRSRMGAWRSLKASLAPNPYIEPDALKNAYYRTQELRERLLRQLSERLNQLHDRREGERYWRILLGPWLLWFVPAVYDRYTRLEKALAIWPKARFIGLANEAFITPGDTMGTAAALKSDLYNLQLFTAIADFLGAPITYRMPTGNNDSPYSLLIRGSWLRAAIKKIITQMLSRRAPIQAKMTYLSPKDSLQLELRLHGLLGLLASPYSYSTSSSTDGKSRAVLGNLSLGEDAVERVLASMVPTQLPRCFVEDFERLGIEQNKKYPKSARFIWSCNSWYFDEPFKRWAAEQATEGALLLGMQHGGGYGCLLLHSSEEHELSITDRYYSWGWTRGGFRANVIPMPATKLLNLPSFAANPSSKQALFVCTSSPCYLMEFPNTPEAFLAYLAWQERFAKALPSTIAEHLMIRLHYEDLGWDMMERWADIAPTARIEMANARPLRKTMASARLCVFDHLSTTFLEALAANQPSVLFWNRDLFLLRPEAVPLFQQLEEAGVLYHDPEAAAAATARAYEDVAAFWNAPRVQDVRKTFCSKYARTAADSRKQWVRELKNLTIQEARKRKQHQE